jgi:hypothetical protein
MEKGRSDERYGLKDRVAGAASRVVCRLAN